MKNCAKKAFTLVELSVVILLIGMVLSVVAASGSIIEKYRLYSARATTQSSGIMVMKNLAVWFDAASDTSFSESETRDGGTISTWYDINPTAELKNNATQSTTSYKPIRYKNCINNLPCVRFDGSDDLLTFDASEILGSDYTVIVVEQKRDNSDRNYYIGGTTGTADENLNLGYHLGYAVWDQYDGGGYTYTITAFTVPQPVINIFVLDAYSSRKYYRNSELLTALGGTDVNPVTVFTGSALGGARPGTNSWFYYGDIGEVIIFNRILKEEERISIEKYLSNKWKIKLS